MPEFWPGIGLGGPEGRAFAAFFNGLSVRSVDQELRCPAMLSWPGPADAWRAIFEQRTVLTFNVDNPYDLEVRAFYFVERDGRWRLVWTSAAVPGCPWEYRFRTPEYAHHALFTALNARDLATLYESIDPACRPPGMARDPQLAIRYSPLSTRYSPGAVSGTPRTHTSMPPAVARRV